MPRIVGRDEEISTLKRLLESKNSEFLALYGRRRIGKTYLIRQFFRGTGAVFFNVTGSKEGALKEQLTHFVQKIGEVFYDGAVLTTPKNWSEAFKVLTKAVDIQPKKKKIVLFFDEIPWMATPKSRLLQSLDYYWNQYWSNDSRIKLIICGSSASWIIHKVINNRGGLHNRITRRMHLEPFTLLETKLFLQSVGVKLDHQQILMLYMVTGGIPHYLADLEAGLSAAQLVEKLAFTKNGILLDEFKNLFASLFHHAEDYIQIIRAIASRRYGIGKNELLSMLGSSAMGGGGAKRLEELEETGFIMGFMPYQHKRRGICYRVVDEYTLFYLKWIEPIQNALQKKSLEEGYWLSLQSAPEWHNWLGYAFEAVCYKHIACIRKALAISPGAIADSWRYVPRKDSEERGAQVDLLFDRRDDAITLCEIKYTDKPFVLSKGDAEVLQRKLEVFKERTGTRKQLFLALISANGLKKNFYTEELIQGLVTLDDFFKKN